MISRLSLFLKKWPLHVLLLPFFFIAGTYNQYAGLLSADEVASTTLYIFVALLITFGGLFLLYKDKTKAGIITTIGGILYLFFGNIKETLGDIPVLEFISHYKTFLPLLFILSVFFLYRSYKAKPSFTLNLFLNLLLIIYSAIELIRFSQLSSSDRSAEWITAKDNSSGTVVVTHPDIYYIVLDCYPNSSYQKDMLGVDSNQLDNYLSEKGFFLVKNSRSNYNYTPFSMAATFNMKYPAWLKDSDNIKPYHYNRAIEAIKSSVVFEKLVQENYQLNNLSGFDMPGNPSIRKGKFLTITSREIILYYSFYKCLKRDILPDLLPAVKSKMITQVLAERKEWHGDTKDYNKLVLDSLLKVPLLQGNKKPSFVYAHLIMPHFPYFYDSTGKAYPDELVFGRGWIANRERFSNYIGYTNKQAALLLDSILKKTNGRDIIIIQSDHGTPDLDPTRKQDAFRNYSAFYFPDRDYKQLYDSMSNVNTFRIIFNKYFDQQLPLLKDSSTFIK